MSNHSPGEWKIFPAEADKDYLRIRGTRLGGRYKIANVHAPTYVSSLPGLLERDQAESEANARLIVCAPELLDALRYARRWLKPIDHDVEFIDAVIARATGADQ
jgi:hypothetical protein